MIVCKSRRFIFLRVPRTASTSLSHHIINNVKMGKDDFYTRFGKIPEYNISDKNFARDEHPNLDYLERTVHNINLEDYIVYGVLRNPIDRFFSLFSQLLTMFSIVDIRQLSRDQIAEKAFEILDSTDIPYHYGIKSFRDKSIHAFPLLPQSKWLIHKSQPINGIIIHPNFRNFLQNITGDCNLIHHINKIEFNKYSNLSQQTIQTIQHFYPEDFRLWEQFSQEHLRLPTVSC